MEDRVARLEALMERLERQEERKEAAETRVREQREELLQRVSSTETLLGEIKEKMPQLNANQQSVSRLQQSREDSRHESVETRGLISIIVSMLALLVAAYAALKGT